MTTVPAPTGDATRDTTNQLAAFAASALDGTPVVYGPGHWLLNKPLVRTGIHPIWGVGEFDSVIVPTPELAGQWVLTDCDLCRHASRTITSTTINWRKGRAGPTGGGFSIAGDRADGVIHGYRTIGSIDDAKMTDFGVYYLAGIGLRLGDPHPAKGLSRGGIVRECIYDNIRVEGCGDDLNTTHRDSIPGYGLPAVDFCQSQDVAAAAGADGSNQINFPNLWTVFNHGTVLQRNYSLTETMRRFTYGTWMLHGHTGGGQTGDLAVIEGLIALLKVKDLRTNSAPKGAACLRVKGYPGSGRPRGIDLTVDISSSFGSGVVVEDADSLAIRGWTNPGAIDAFEVQVAPDSAVHPGTAALDDLDLTRLRAVGGARVPRKFSIPANVTQGAS